MKGCDDDNVAESRRGSEPALRRPQRRVVCLITSSSGLQDVQDLTTRLANPPSVSPAPLLQRLRKCRSRPPVRSCQ